MKYITPTQQVLEQEGRHKTAIEWAQAELSCVVQDCRNAPLKARASRLLARCHWALGEDSLSAAALDASMTTAKTNELLYSECLAVCERARMGKAATAAAAATATTAVATSRSGSAHWAESTGRQRLLEVRGRMDGGSEGLLDDLLPRL